MKTRNQRILLFVVALFIASGIFYFTMSMNEERKELTQETELLEVELASRDSAYNMAVDLLFGIEAEVERIKNRENIVTERSLNEHDPYSEEQLLSDMKGIDSLILSANSRISNLVDQLEKADLNLNSFRRKVNQLNKDLEKQSKSIALLKSDLKIKDYQIVELRKSVSSLEKENEEQLLTISSQMDKLLTKDLEQHTAYIAIGSREELMEQKLVTREGGVLGLGRTTELADNADVEKFAEVDVRTTDKLFLNASKVELVTEHPTNSFELVSDGNTISHIEIIDPDEFWKLSNYLVIALKS